MSARATSGPLSYAQQEMVRGMKRLPEGAQWYDWICVFEIAGELQVPELVAALDDLTRRHDMLRTTLHERDGKVLQATAPAPGGEASCRSADARCSPAELLSGYLAPPLALPEVLSGADLFRPEIIALGPARHLLVFAIHHLLYDGLSTEVLFRDLGELYAARVEGRAAELPAIASTYLQSVARERVEMAGLRDEATEFWRRLAGDATVRVDWPCPTADDFSFTMTSRDLIAGGTALADLREAARVAGATPFMVLLCATGAAIGRVTGQHPVLLGTDIANRAEPFKQDLVGIYLNNRISRVENTPGRLLLEVVAEIREQWFEAARYETAYIDQVFPEGVSPHIVRVNQEPIDMSGALRLAGLEVRPVATSHEWPHWRDIFINWVQRPDGYSVLFMRRPAVVDDTVIDGLTAALSDLLANPLSSRC